MPNRKKRFADDGWAIWVDGDDTSTVYINDWLDPKGKSHVDVAVRIRGVRISTNLHVYVPFSVKKEEVTDVSLMFHDKNILQAIFSAACIVDFKKNAHTSEIAYNGKTVDIVHVGTLETEMRELAGGTLISIGLEALHPFLDNDEAYFIWRMPHRSLDEIFRPRVDVGNLIERLRDLITTPVVSEKYGYSIRINESRLLPEEINRIGAFHRQKLKKAVVSLSINENYELNDAGCYRIRRLEEKLYREYLPKDYKYQDVITYQWNQNRDDNLMGHFNFYYNISANSVKRGSMLVYLILLFLLGAMGDLLSDLIKMILGALF